ncbi:MAG: aquaporin family protein [Spirochaetaceae bacterium]|jgi:glycerol uptake facilitator protein|nr:aquaporin family protein [Spirochaetaceae bacterium]
MNPYLAEFIGTGLLILLGDGVVANVILNKTKGNGGGWVVITMGWALAVFVPATIFGLASGAHFNPALTLAIAINGGMAWAQVPGYILCQFAGAFVGAFFVWLMYKNHFDQTPDQGTQLGVFSTGPAIRDTASNLISEIIGTFVLVFALLACTAGESTKVGNFYVWAVICTIGMSLGGTTGYAINPARDLGPRIAHAVLPIKGKGSSDWGYAWIPVVGPVIGAILGGITAQAVIPFIS